MTAGQDSTAAGRLAFVDSLRGFALFGVFWANLLIFSGIDYMTSEQRASLFRHPVDDLAFFVERFFIENKFMGLFSLLFGISFWLFLSRVQSRTASATTLFYRRIFWLFAIGAVHGWLLWCFDVLRFYALWAVLLPFFVNAPPRRVLAAALMAGILVPAVVAGAAAARPPVVGALPDSDGMALAAFSNGSFREFLVANWKYDWYLTLSISQIAYQVAVFGRFLVGLYAARTFDLSNPGSHRVLLRKVLFVGGLAGLVGSSIFAGDLLPSASQSPALASLRRLLVEGGQLGMTLAYASAMGLLFATARWTHIVRLFAPIGQMALTWYLLQTAFGLWMFYGFPHGPGLMGNVGAAALAGISVVGFAAQISMARAWMARFRFGPAEWCWRSLTYGALQPFRK